MTQSSQNLNSVPITARIVAPYVRHELPGWGALARLTGIANPADPRWRNAPTRTHHGKWHGYDMPLNLADWSERQTYFLGRYHDLAAQLLIDACVRPGERVLDVGANIGMLTLHAAARLGPEGVVDAFEPNPVCSQRIQNAIAQNHIDNVRLHPFGLGDSAGSFTLSILDNHSGMGTLAAVNGGSAHAVTSTVAVQVKVGDEILPADDRKLSLVKVDVEGFEVKVLETIPALLARTNTVVVEWHKWITPRDPVDDVLGRAGLRFVKVVTEDPHCGVAFYERPTRVS